MRLHRIASRSMARPAPVADVARYTYRGADRPMRATMSGRDTRVLMKLVVDGTSDSVVGCHIVGDYAAEMIQLLGIAVKLKATKADFDATMALHPTAAEELVTMRTPTARHVRQAAE